MRPTSLLPMQSFVNQLIPEDFCCSNELIGREEFPLETCLYHLKSQSISPDRMTCQGLRQSECLHAPAHCTIPRGPCIDNGMRLACPTAWPSFGLEAALAPSYTPLQQPHVNADRKASIPSAIFMLRQQLQRGGSCRSLRRGRPSVRLRRRGIHQCQSAAQAQQHSCRLRNLRTQYAGL